MQLTTQQHIKYMQFAARSAFGPGGGYTCQQLLWHHAAAWALTAAYAGRTPAAAGWDGWSSTGWAHGEPGAVATQWLHELIVDWWPMCSWTTLPGLALELGPRRGHRRCA